MSKTKNKTVRRRFITNTQAAAQLEVSRATFYRMRPKLIARGLKCIKIGGYVRYLESSLEKVITKALEN
jgi:predicted DNA-binding transcriptional regulator AlpA